MIKLIHLWSSIKHKIKINIKITEHCHYGKTKISNKHNLRSKQK